MTVSALAVADGPADAVGVVQLACEEDSLSLTLLRAGAYKHGFIPGILARGVTLRVPYPAVRGLVRRQKALVLTLDRSVPSPFHRFALARFTDDPAETLAPIHRAHRVVSTLAWALPGPIGALAAALPSESLVGGALGRASLALLVALVAGAAMRSLAAWLAWGGPVSDRHRERFETAIADRLGLLPKAPEPASTVALPTANLPTANLPAQSPAPRAPRIAPPPQISLEGPEAPAVHWGKIIGLATIVAAGLISALVFVERYGTTDLRPASETDSALSAARAELPPPEPPPPPPPGPERCFCARADSPLWQDGIPVLTVLTTTGPEGTVTPPEHHLDKRKKPVFEYDLIVVNNSALRLREVRVVLTYARRDKNNKRIAVTDRGLYWGNPLAPGRAVKWSTEGPGTEVRIDKSEEETLAKRGTEPAPADAFFALTEARHRVVRLHAAMMLAYLHDGRVGEALAAVGPPIPAEAWTIRRIRAASEPIFACDVQASSGELSACVFNSSSKVATGVSLREIQDDDAKAPRAWPLSSEVPVHEGVRVRIAYEGEAPSDLTVSRSP